MELEDLFYYDETSLSCLRWKVDRYSGKGYTVLNVQSGDMAGGLHHEGYYVVRVGGRKVPVHRIIFELHYGPIPKGLFIDHVDGVRSNNRIENLRVVTKQQNQQNAKMYSNNTSGYTGVQEFRGKDGSHRFIVQWKDAAGGLHTKTFAVSKLGYENAKRLAIEYRAKMIAELNAKGACYTERHGKPKEEVDG